MKLTPSIAWDCTVLLDFLSKHEGISYDDSRSVPGLSSDPAGVFRVISSVLWVQTGQSDAVQITDRGTEALNTNPIEAKVQMLLKDFIKITKPPWAQLIPYGRRVALKYAPQEIRQVFEECYLAYGIDDDIVAFWDEVAQTFREQRNSGLVDIGRKGERLTYFYEFDRTGHHPKWLALESSYLGYDILSRISADVEDPMRIEVKTSEKRIEYAKFYLTHNEWKVTRDSVAHKFYLWNLCGDQSHLAVLSVDDVQNHIPENSGSGKWMNVEIPFQAFESKFICVS